MGKVGITGAEVERGDAERGETGHVRPAVLGHGHAPHGSHERAHGRRGEPGRCAGRTVGQLKSEAVEDVADMVERLEDITVRSEPIVDRNRAGIRDDVAGDAAADPHGVEALAVRTAVDRHLPRSVRGQALQQRRGAMDRVIAEPGPRRVRPASAQRGHNPQGALTARLDLPRCRLQEDREIGVQPVAMVRGKPA